MNQKLLLIIVFFCLGLASATFAATFELDKAQFHFEEGLNFKANQELDQAEDHFKQAIDIDPSRPEFHFELSNIYALRHDYLRQARAEAQFLEQTLRACMQELEETLRLKPDFIPAMYNLGVVYKNLGEYERAREAFRRLLTKQPDQSQAYIQIGDTYAAQGFFEEAREAYQKAKSLNPNDLSADEALRSLQMMETEHQAQRPRSLMIPTELLPNSQFRASQNPLAGYGAGAQDPRQQQQALPYAGMALLQELMKGKTRSVES